MRASCHTDEPREDPYNLDRAEVPGEQALESSRCELLDVFDVVAESAYVLAPTEVSETKPWFPWHRHHAAPGSDPRQLFDRRLRCHQVFQDFDAGRHVGNGIAQR